MAWKRNPFGGFSIWPTNPLYPFRVRWVRELPDHVSYGRKGNQVGEIREPAPNNGYMGISGAWRHRAWQLTFPFYWSPRKAWDKRTKASAAL